MGVFVGKRGGEAVDLEIEGLDGVLVRWLELMGEGVVRVLGVGGR